MKFRVTGYAKDGTSLRETVEAPSAREAGEEVARRGVFVSEVREVRGEGAGRRRVPRLGGGARAERAAAFLRQLAVLVQTGTPLVEAITSIERQQPAGAWRDALASMRTRLEEGSQLSETLAQHPAYFDGVCRSLISAGESGGRLDAMLQRLAVFMRQRVRVRKQLTGALVYPALLVVVALGVTAGMLGFVMPRFEGLFKTLDAPLPPTTRLLMDTSALVRTYWYVVVGVALGIPASLYVYAGTPGGRRALERCMLRTPQVGRLMRGFALARLSRVLGVLLEGRVPMLDALRLTREAAGVASFEALLGEVESSVTRGENVSTAFSQSDLVPPVMVEAIRSGERSGQVPAVLLAMADAMDEDNEVLLKTVTGLLEPVILVLLGLVVGGMAISMFLPLFDLTAAGGGR
ncbi:MAG: type II secretion system F family protein [Planctomycetota bacterium]|nr:type II secretion system F family protein [Planctomycetota bacterium]